MPGKVRVKIIAGRNLPVMDRSSDTTDAYVEIKLGSDTFKTDVYRKSLHPQWNTDWFRFEVSDYLIIYDIGHTPNSQTVRIYCGCSSTLFERHIRIINIYETHEK